MGRNIAEAAQRGLSEGDVRLISPVGAAPSGEGGDGSGAEVDTVGKVIMAEMAAVGMRTDGLIVKARPANPGVAPQPAVGRAVEGDEGPRSSACTLVLGKDGDLEAGVADMGIVERVTVEEVRLCVY